MAKKRIKRQNPVGRPTLWTEENRQSIIGYLENGATYERASLLSLVSKSTFYEWKAQGETDRAEGKETEFSKFLDDIERAREKYVQWLQGIVNHGCEMTPKLALEVLERIRKEEFSKQSDLNIKGNFNVKNFDVELSPEEEEEYKNRLKAFWGDSKEEESPE